MSPSLLFRWLRRKGAAGCRCGFLSENWANCFSSAVFCPIMNFPSIFWSPRVCLFVSLRLLEFTWFSQLFCYFAFFLFFHAFFFFFFVLVWNAGWHDSATGLENKRDQEVHYATLKNTCTNTQIKESLSTEVEDGDKHVFSPNLHTHTQTHTGGVNFFPLCLTHTHTRVHAHTFRGMHMHTLKTQWSS